MSKPYQFSQKLMTPLFIKKYERYQININRFSLKYFFIVYIVDVNILFSIYCIKFSNLTKFIYTAYLLKYRSYQLCFAHMRTQDELSSAIDIRPNRVVHVTAESESNINTADLPQSR